MPSALAAILANIIAGIPPIAVKIIIIISSGNKIEVNSSAGTWPEKIKNIAKETVNVSPIILAPTLRNQKYLPFSKIFHLLIKKMLTNCPTNMAIMPTIVDLNNEFKAIKHANDKMIKSLWLKVYAYCYI